MNPIKNKGIPIELDKTRHLLLNLNSMVELEERYGTLDKALDTLSPENGSPSMKEIRYLLYLSLAHEDETLTEKDAGALITLGNINEVVDALGKAMNTSLPEVDEDEKN